MTVLANYVTNTYLCDGVTKEFAVTFQFFDDEIEVYKDKTFNTFKKGIDYQIENNEAGSGGTVIFNEAPAAGSSITIVRSVVLNQLVKFIEGEAFPASDYEYSLDRIVMALQEMKERISRCTEFPVGEDGWKTFLQSNVKFDADMSEWSDGVSYESGRILSYVSEEDGVKRWYISLADDNVGHKPSEESSSWWLLLSYSAEAVEEKFKTKADVLDFKLNPFIAKNKVLDVGGWITVNPLSEEYLYHSTLTCLTDVPYREGLDCSGYVTLSIEDATSGNFAPVAEFSYIENPITSFINLNCTVYAKEIPLEMVHIDTVAFFVKEIH